MPCTKVLKVPFPQSFPDVWMRLYVSQHLCFLHKPPPPTQCSRQNEHTSLSLVESSTSVILVNNPCVDVSLADKAGSN